MRNLIIVLGGIALLLGGFLYVNSRNKQAPVLVSQEPATTSAVTVVAEGLDTPWALVFLPDKSMLVTERAGKVRLVNNNGQLEEKPVTVLGQVKEMGEGGLLGIDIHPNFAVNGFVYLYYTYGGEGGNTLNRVVRMTYQDKQLRDEQIIVNNIPGASNHNGGRIRFGPDGFLYITTGDAENPSQAQNTDSLAGKILRVTDEGKAAPGNPFNNLVFSYGHRNPQGLVWESQGRLWTTEHGPSGVQTGNDEINKVQAGKNYGWPEIQGDQTREGMEAPIKHSGRIVTWAPAGADFTGNSLFFAGLRGQTLYEAVIDNNQVVQIKEHLNGQYGRLREVILGPDNMLYIATSNKDGRGNPSPGDDKIIRVNIQGL